MRKIINVMKNLLLDLTQLWQENWWAEITTSEPNCIYYFGPFSTSKEATEIYPDYIEDLKEEGAQRISTTVKRCNPQLLTIWDAENE